MALFVTSRHETAEDQLASVVDLEPTLTDTEREVCEQVGLEVLIALSAKTDLFDLPGKLSNVEML